jgi:hypothetical protein
MGDYMDIHKGDNNHGHDTDTHMVLSTPKASHLALDWQSQACQNRHRIPLLFPSWAPILLVPFHLQMASPSPPFFFAELAAYQG